jgi:hypothetical protein
MTSQQFQHCQESQLIEVTMMKMREIRFVFIGIDLECNAVNCPNDSKHPAITIASQGTFYKTVPYNDDLRR